jgi:riboflavin kinase/FMN adenylyltransferase
MTTFNWDDLLRGRVAPGRPVRLSVGVFDGVHVGHRKLLEEITGGSADWTPLVITFSRSPVIVHSPESFPGSVLSYAQKMERIGACGVETAVVIDFSEEMSNLSGEAFVRLLTRNLTIQRIVVGQNFRFGKKRISGTDDLKEMLSEAGIQLLVTQPVLRGGSIVSSSRIRAAVRAGRLGEAREMLGTDHAIDLRGAARPSVGGSFLRISRHEIGQVLPPVGEYPVRSESPAGAMPGTCRIDDEWLTLAADNCGSAATMVFTETDERSSAQWP